MALRSATVICIATEKLCIELQRQSKALISPAMEWRSEEMRRNSKARSCNGKAK